MYRRHVRQVSSAVGAVLTAAGLSLGMPPISQAGAAGQSEETGARLTQRGDRGVYEVLTNKRTLGTGDPALRSQYQLEVSVLREGDPSHGERDGAYIQGALYPVGQSGGVGTYWRDTASGSIVELGDGAGRGFSSTSGGPGGAGLPLIPAHLRPGESARYEYELSFPTRAFPHAVGTRIVTMGHPEVIPSAFGDIEAYRVSLVDSRQTQGVNELYESDLWFNARYGLLEVETTVLVEDGERRTVTTTTSALVPPALPFVAAVP